MANAASIGPLPRTSVGRNLECRRLEHRARRLGLVITLLRERASSSSHAGAVPPGLQQAISDFSTELSRVRRRLHGELPDDRQVNNRRPQKDRGREPQALPRSSAGPD
jgi:hypothetical protein